ncbi:MAG: hypothetical protein ABWJ42_01075 [Sulfolobales archaeon]
MSGYREIRFRRVAGLDLAASSRRCSGFSVIDIVEMSIECVKCLYSDAEILNEIEKHDVELIAIDAPIAPEPVYRLVDRKARSLGYPVLPPTLGPMRVLVKRAWSIKLLLENIGIRVIETHPRSAMISSRAGDLYELVERLGLRLRDSIELNELNKDQIDSIIAAIVAYCYSTQYCIEKIEERDGVIYIIRSLDLVSHR